MKKEHTQKPIPETRSYVRLFAEQAFSRAAGAPLIQGNSVSILKNASENYPAWLDAMRNASRTIHFETYILYDDDIGNEFADVMAARAREGIRVRLVYDWLGALGRSSRGLWKKMTDAGVEVRCFNPPAIDNPLGWVNRDHRKMIAVDGSTAFVSGLCIGRPWAGCQEKGISEWRDTGVMVKGPAVADIEKAFAGMWASMGPELPRDEMPEIISTGFTGGVNLRVVANIPNSAGIFRMDQLVAAIARRSLWLTDAYFLGVPTYVQALMASARDGVDVRMLVPGTTDIPVLRAVSRATYQPLLESGVRIFEWNGPMLHAKTAVADGRWARIGSSNMNISSWLGNYELDIAVDDADFALAMEEMYVEDLSLSTEIVLGRRNAAVPAGKRPWARRRAGEQRKGGIRRAGIGFIRAGRVVESAITNRRLLGPADTRIMSIAGLMLLGLASVALAWPRVLAVPVACMSAWLAEVLFMKAYRALYKSRTVSPPHSTPDVTQNR